MKVFLLLFTSFLCFSQESSLQDFAQALKEQDINRIMTYVVDEIVFEVCSDCYDINTYPEIFTEGNRNKEDVKNFLLGAWEKSLFDLESIEFIEYPLDDLYIVEVKIYNRFLWCDFNFAKTNNVLRLYSIYFWFPAG